MSVPHAPNTSLLDGETVIDSWQPKLTLFGHRALILSFVTALVLASLGYLSLWQWLIAVPLFSVIFVLIFDDVSTWFRHRSERWYLTNKRLIFENSGAPEDNANLTLDQIVWMRPWFWWSLQLGFASGTSTAIRFVPRPRELRTRILDAKAAFEDGTND